MPWKQIPDYEFQTVDGEVVKMSELFGEKDTLVVYHMMMGAECEKACPSCTMWVHSINGSSPYLDLRVSTAVIAKAPPRALKPYCEREKWMLKIVSSSKNSFNLDLGMETKDGKGFCGGQAPGVSVFVLRDKNLYHTYSCAWRGIDIVNNIHQLLDFTPGGRQNLNSALHPNCRPVSDSK